jgi:hypothetical protein
MIVGRPTRTGATASATREMIDAAFDSGGAK